MWRGAAAAGQAKVVDVALARPLENELDVRMVLRLARATVWQRPEIMNTLGIKSLLACTPFAFASTIGALGR